MFLRGNDRHDSYPVHPVNQSIFSFWLSLAHAFRLLFPLFDFHIAEAINRLVTPGKAQVSQLGIKHDIAAIGTGPFNVIFPEFYFTSAFRAKVLGDVFRSPKSGIHSRAFMQGHELVLFQISVHFHSSYVTNIGEMAENRLDPDQAMG